MRGVEEFLERERFKFRLRFVSNDNSSNRHTDPSKIIGTLYVKNLSTCAHDDAAAEVSNQILFSMHDAYRVERSFSIASSLRIRFDNRMKEPDSTCRPCQRVVGGAVLYTGNGISPCPPLVVEVALHHESEVALRAELDEWVTDQDSSVMVDVGIKIDYALPDGTRPMRILVYRRLAAANPEQLAELDVPAVAGLFLLPSGSLTSTMAWRRMTCR